MTVLLSILAFAVGLIIGYLALHSQMSGAQTRCQMMQRLLAEQRNNYEQQIADMKNTADERTAAVKASCEAKMEDMRAMYDTMLADARRSHERHAAELKAGADQRLMEVKRDFKEQMTEQKEQMEHAMHLISERLKNASEQTLKQRSEELSAVNMQQMEKILTPLQDGLRQMRDEVEKNRQERAQTLTTLDTTIRQTLEQTRELGERADKLANALTRDNKYQGNFGELCLSKMLEDMGFERGKHFTEQTTLRDDNNEPLLGEDSERKMQPDVILHFPDNRDIIIDSKVSMTAFERYANATDDAQRKQALKEHVASVRRQAQQLTKKSYWRQYNQNGVKLDFVVMFMFSESALRIAMDEDPKLWQEAYNQGVLITSGQNLYALLRILEISWKQMAQMENQHNIMKCANEMVARVQLFYERFLNVEKKLKDAERSFDELKTVTAPTGRSIITTARQLLDYGAKEDPKRRLALPKDDDTPPDMEGSQAIG